MRSTEIKKQIATLQEELAQALEYENSLASGSQTAIAEFLHARQCRSNHIDQCDWHYYDWTNLGYARQEYLKKADKLLAKAKKLKVDPMTMVEILRED
jgi:hypothetical protein